MRLHYARILLVALLCTASGAALALGEPTPADIPKTVAAIRGYDYGGSETALRAVDRLIHQTFGKPQLRAAIEKELVAALQSDVTLACKQFICRKLAMIGSEASLPIMAKMLASDDGPTVEIACYSLSQIRSLAVNGISRDALGRAKGKSLTAIVTLLGIRRDQQSVGPLTVLAQDKDAMVSDAAIAALGRISGNEAAAVLARLRKVDDAKIRAAAEHASLVCARQLAAQSDAAGAKAIYQSLADSEASIHIRRGAILGRIALGGPDIPAYILSMMGKDDKITAAVIASIPTIRAADGVTLLVRKLDDLPAQQKEC